MRIVLADSKERELAELRHLLEQDRELQVVGEADELGHLLTQVQDSQPNLVLLDWDLTGLSAHEFLYTLHSRYCPLKVIAFGDSRTGQYEALAAGADAYVCREEPMEWLLSTLRSVVGLSPHYAG
jgi:DNA-binding NarL/FixJ family response regulator